MRPLALLEGVEPACARCGGDRMPSFALPWWGLAEDPAETLFGWLCGDCIRPVAVAVEGVEPVQSRLF